jgi:hypothetical protein
MDILSLYSILKCLSACHGGLKKFGWTSCFAPGIMLDYSDTLKVFRFIKKSFPDIVSERPEGNMDTKKTLKILFVGFENIGMLISEELCEHGMQHVETEISPEQAKVRLSEKNSSFDLLITGNRIQDKDNAGMDLVRWTKENFPGIKVILMSVFSDNEEGAICAGADAFWHTSYDLSGLIHLIEEFFADSS